jgi:phosphopantetheinyl transferase
MNELADSAPRSAADRDSFTFCDAVKVRLVRVTAAGEAALYCSACNERAAERRPGSRRELKNLLLHAMIDRMHEERIHLSDIDFSAGALGRPLLLIRGRLGPSISFSNSDGKTWAAMGVGGSRIGIDAASGREFDRKYPFHRAFGNEELRFVVERFRVPRSDAAALLWSAKEATAKALGCGFHLVDPLDLRVHPRSDTKEADESTVEVRLVGRARRRLPLMADIGTPVVCFREEGAWISLASVNR